VPSYHPHGSEPRGPGGHGLGFPGTYGPHRAVDLEGAVHRAIAVELGCDRVVGWVAERLAHGHGDVALIVQSGGPIWTPARLVRVRVLKSELVAKPLPSKKKRERS
jgi:hypothetical protein